MKSIFFLVSRVSHIATARAIASSFPVKQKKTIIIVYNFSHGYGQFSGAKKALIAAKKDSIWSTVETTKSLISYLSAFDSSHVELFMYTDFGIRINYYLYRIYQKTRIHVFQDGSSSRISDDRKLRLLNYVYSFLMGDNFRVKNFVGQSRFISSLYLYDVERSSAAFEFGHRNEIIKRINEGFLDSINTLIEKSYIEKYSLNNKDLKDNAILFLPGFNLKPILIDYIIRNFDGMKFIKTHPAGNKDLSNFEGYTSISPHYMAEQVILELLLKFKKTIVILESEATSFTFSKVHGVEFYIASISKDEDVQISKLLMN